MPDVCYCPILEASHITCVIPSNNSASFSVYINQLNYLYKFSAHSSQKNDEIENSCKYACLYFVSLNEETIKTRHIVFCINISFFLIINVNAEALTGNNVDYKLLNVYPISYNASSLIL